MSWRIIYVEESEYLSLYLDNLKVKKGIDETTIPLSDINSIIIDNYRASITIGLINKCMEYKINVITCGLTHLPLGIITPYSGNHQSTYQLLKQIKWSIESLEIAWQYFIKAKIRNQIKTLIIARKSKEVIERLSMFEEQVELADITNREGLSAKMYFRELFGENFKRFEYDSINASLNYGYSILRSQITRALVARGLNPHIGIFHRGPANSFNLADDFIECFRPIIDYWTYCNINFDDTFNRELRLKIIALFTKKVIYDNKKVTIINAINILIDNFLDFMETGEIDKLVFPDIQVYEVI